MTTAPGGKAASAAGRAARIVIIGTADTKAAELAFMQQCIADAGAIPQIMDVGIMGRSSLACAHTNDAVAAAAGTTIPAIAGLADESHAMTRMSEGAVKLSLQLHAAGKLNGVVMLGGSMGTDLALDVALALPLGVPKVIVSTIAFSHLIPPNRIAADLMMVLWAGGLYGLNDICKASLERACLSVVGASQAVPVETGARPLVGMTSLGKTCLSYMARLKPALETRGYELAVFHTSGMGGQAFEQLAAQRKFVLVMDFSLQELANEMNGSIVTAGKHRLESAGQAGIPQLVAPGAADMIDFPSWSDLRTTRFEGRACHEHNRLVSSVAMTVGERRALAREVANKLACARGPVKFILPLGGIQAWDLLGEGLYAPEALAGFIAEVRSAIRSPVELVETASHINDQGFADKVMEIFDEWVQQGVIPRGSTS